MADATEGRKQKLPITMKSILSLFRITTASLLVVGPMAAALAAESPPTADRPTDDMVTRAVEKTLRYDPRVYAADVDVATEEGIVTLSGFIENLPMKRYAIELTETRRGVRSVVDRLELLPERLDDKLVQHSVDQALAIRNELFESGVEAKVDDGTVHLTGKVGSFAMSDLAERAVESIRGVRGVVNDLHIEPLEKRGDAELRQHIELALRDDPWIEAGLVTAEVKDGKVVLAGMIDSLAEKRRLRETVSIPGVTGIEQDDLIVTSGLLKPDERPKQPKQRPDEEIERSVVAALSQDPRLRRSGLEVAVTGGEVSLKGTVDNLQARRAVVADAKNSPGVSQVYDYVEIKPANPLPDEELARALQTLVESDVHLIGSEIEVKADRGKVTLSGHVDTEFQWDHAASLVSGGVGVRDVENRLRVLWPVPKAYRDLLSESHPDSGKREGEKAEKASTDGEKSLETASAEAGEG